MQINKSSNTDQYQHQYRPIQATSFSLFALVLMLVKSGAVVRTARAAHTNSFQLYRCFGGFCASQPLHFSGRSHTLFVVVR